MNVTFSTNGRGLWSRARKTVTVTDMRVPYINDEGDFGELRVYFDTSTWDVDKDGLIYTDPQFVSELRDFLVAKGLSKDCDYSEAGMQGDNYVSLDVGSDFLTAWEAKFGVSTVL